MRVQPFQILDLRFDGERKKRGPGRRGLTPRIIPQSDTQITTWAVVDRSRLWRNSTIQEPRAWRIRDFETRRGLKETELRLI
jgi:hypothetical protein